MISLLDSLGLYMIGSASVTSINDLLNESRSNIITRTKESTFTQLNRPNISIEIDQ